MIPSIANGYTVPKRVALVIGNSNYQAGSQPLRSSRNDAQDMADMLEHLNFDVTIKINANQAEIAIVIEKFGKQLSQNTVALFYYSGHAVHYSKENYLVPIDFKFPLRNPKNQLSRQATPLNSVLNAVQKAHMGIVILDGYRDHLAKDVTGLKRLSPQTDPVLIAYASDPFFGKGTVDSQQRNNLYTAQLLNLISRSTNLSIEKILKQVESTVRQETQGKQRPWYNSTLTEEFFLLTSTTSILIIDSNVDEATVIISGKKIKHLKISYCHYG
jgi:uncharacterized caspase-like protein